MGLNWVASLVSRYHNTMGSETQEIDTGKETAQPWENRAPSLFFLCERLSRKERRKSALAVWEQDSETISSCKRCSFDSPLPVKRPRCVVPAFRLSKPTIACLKGGRAWKPVEYESNPVDPSYLSST